MNKKLGVIVAVLLLLGLGGFFFMNKNKTGVGNTSGTTSESKSLKDLLSMGIAQKCTFASTEATGAASGTTYISGGKVRGDFSTTVEGKVVASHMISDGKTSYIWTDGEKNGFKMTVEETDKKDMENTMDTSVGSQADLNQKADYKCTAWVVDDSYFTPPTTVTFQDFSEMYKTLPSSGESNGSSQCSYCNALTGEDKTQCLTALKCN